MQWVLALLLGGIYGIYVMWLLTCTSLPSRKEARGHLALAIIAGAFALAVMAIGGLWILLIVTEQHPDDARVTRGIRLGMTVAEVQGLVEYGVDTCAKAKPVPWRRFELPSELEVKRACVLECLRARTHRYLVVGPSARRGRSCLIAFGDSVAGVDSQGELIWLIRFEGETVLELISDCYCVDAGLK